MSPVKNLSFLARGGGPNTARSERDEVAPPTHHARGKDEKWLAIETKKHALAASAASNDYLFSLANDPSVARHLIEKNVRKGVPSLLDRAEEASQLTNEAKIVYEDVNDTVASLDDVCDTPVFKSVYSKLFCATEFAKELLVELGPAPQSPHDKRLSLTPGHSRNGSAPPSESSTPHR